MANIVRWEPFRDMMSLRQAMDRLFDESFVSPATSWNGSAFSAPAVDMYQTDDEIVVKATIPGIKPDNLHLNVTGDMLSIEGETHDEVSDEQANYVVRERRFGKFHRQIALPTPVNADRAKAEFEHGVLTLTLPKVEEVKPKQIPVKVK
ncbi:MAG: Hsp20/alpha crystallin family protein [Anaerolineales bacterium]